MAIKEFHLDTKSAGAQALEGLWGPLAGDLLYDMSAKGKGRGNHATRIGSEPRSAPSLRGHVPVFDGVGDAFDTERSLDIGTDAFTVMAWVWQDSTGLTLVPAIMSQGDFGGDEWMLRINNATLATANLTVYAGAAGINIGAPAGSYHPFKDEWAHVAVARWIGAGAGCSIYQNGVLMGTDATAGDNLNTPKVLQIGGADNHALRWFAGMLDDVRYYSRALSLAQINHIYVTTRYTPYADITLRLKHRHVTTKGTVKVL